MPPGASKSGVFRALGVLGVGLSVLLWVLLFSIGLKGFGVLRIRPLFHFVVFWVIVMVLGLLGFCYL